MMSLEFPKAELSSSSLSGVSDTCYETSGLRSSLPRLRRRGGEINSAHPFREGNTRAQAVIVAQFAAAHGHFLFRYHQTAQAALVASMPQRLLDDAISDA